MPPATVATLGVLGLFALWGARRGSLRQLAALGVLAVAFLVAARLGPRLHASVEKAITLGGRDLALVAWSAAFLGVLLAGAAVLALVGPWLSRARLGFGERTVGALLGLVHGLVIVTLILQGVRAAWPLPASRPIWLRVEGTPLSDGADAVGGTLAGVLPTPRWLAGPRGRVRRSGEGGAAPAPP